MNKIRTCLRPADTLKLALFSACVALLTIGSIALPAPWAYGTVLGLVGYGWLAPELFARHPSRFPADYGSRAGLVICLIGVPAGWAVIELGAPSAAKIGILGVAFLVAFTAGTRMRTTFEASGGPPLGPLNLWRAAGPYGNRRVRPRKPYSGPPGWEPPDDPI